MFYPTDILKKRGKFGLIWLAATKGKKLNRRQLCSVNINQASENIISIVNQHTLQGEKMYSSLYLSSQLMAGITCIYDMQTKYLLEDVKSAILKLGEPKSTTVDLDKTLRAKITLDEIDMVNVPIDFGVLQPFLEPSDYPIQLENYFLVNTPRSFAESSTPGSAIHGIFEPEFGDAESLYVSRKEDITMPDVPPFLFEEPLPEIDQEPVDILAPPFHFIPTPAEHESDVAHQIPEDQILHRNGVDKQIFLTPEIPADEEGQISPRHISTIPTLISSELPIGSCTSDRQRTFLSELPKSFVLPPVVPPERKHKHRHRQLIIDTVTTIPAERMRRNISSAEDLFTVPLIIPSVLEPADSLLSRLGADLVPSGMMKRFKKLQTLPQPDELIGHFMPEEPIEDLREDDSRTTAFPTVEQQRAAETFEDTKASTSVLKTSSLKTLEASSSLTGRREELLLSPSHILREDIPSILVEPVSEIEPIFDFGTPKLDFMDEKSKEDSLKDEMKRCIMSPVSPERTPPPPSPQPKSEILNEAFELIKETAARSVIPNVTTFSAVLENVHTTKKRVASLFNSLLFLHAEGYINVQQPVSGAEIFIQIIEAGSAYE